MLTEKVVKKGPNENENTVEIKGKKQIKLGVSPTFLKGKHYTRGFSALG